MPTFDGENLLIRLDAATPTVDVQVDLYSDWKEYIKTGTNIRFVKAFSRSAGGQTTIPGEVSGRNFFLRNDLGWRIQPAEEDAEIDLVGNLFKFDATLPMIIPTDGAFTVLINIQRSSLALVEQTGVSGLTASESITFAQFADIEGGLDIQAVTRLMLSALQGVLSGAEPASLTIITKSLDGLKDRLTVTKDVNGNRQVVVRDSS